MIATIEDLIPYLVLVAYLLTLLALGWVGYRRNKRGEEDYFLASRNQGPIVSSLSIMATFFSAFALLGAPGMVYREGVAFVLFALNLPVAGAAIYLIGTRVWRLGRARGYVTPADLISDYYDSPHCLRSLVALCALLWVVPYIMMQIQAGGVVSEKLFPAENSFSIGAMTLAAVTTLYVLVGGMRSVAWSDVLQGILLIGGMLLGGATVVIMIGGVSAFGNALLELPSTSLTLPGNTGSWPWPKLLTVCSLSAIAGILQPAQWMRLYAARGPNTLKKCALSFTILLPPCFLFGTMLVGLGGQILFPLLLDGSGGVNPASAVGDYNSIFVVILRDQLPALIGSAGLILASIALVAIMAASMSTADSSLHALSAVTVRDIYAHFVRPRASERERLWVGKLTIVATTVLALWLVLEGRGQNAIGDKHEVLQMLVAMGLVAVAFSAQLIPIAADVLFIRRGTRAGAIAGLISGLLGAYIFGDLLSPTASNFPSLVSAVARIKELIPVDASAWGLIFNVPIFILVSAFTQPVKSSTIQSFSTIVSSKSV